MNKALRTWLVFAGFALLGILAMIWLSRVALRLERAEALATRQAAVEEKARLALWRMDSALAPLMSQESARPYFHYRSFYPAERAYTRMYSELTASEVLVSSPLLNALPSRILLHFQVDPKDRFSSPQVPATTQGQDLDPGQLQLQTQRLADVRSQLDRDQLLTILPPLEGIPARKESTAPFKAAQLAKNVLPEMKETLEPLPIPQSTAQAVSRQTAPQQPPQTESQQMALNQGEFNARMNQVPLGTQRTEQRPRTKSSIKWGSSSLAREVAPVQKFVPPPKAPAQPVTNEEAVTTVQKAEPPSQPKIPAQCQTNVKAIEGAGSTIHPAPHKASIKARPTPVVSEGPITALWVGEHLYLLRRVRIDGAEYLQGSWLDWASIQQWLTQSISDLLPKAELIPVHTNSQGEAGRLLASIPVQLVPGPVEVPSASGATPIRVALFLGWGCALLAGIAAFVLLHKAMLLSERRGAFVSAVTHELRTPLTTFRMYTDMLLMGLDRDEAERRSILTTLSAESDRLDHLVKNVLLYARLEGNRSRMHREDISLAELLERPAERLQQRAGQGGFSLEVSLPLDIRSLSIKTDPSAVEQILFNLVDNACKYAHPATLKRIHLKAFVEGSSFVIKVQDHGPGLGTADRKRLFQPFSKSASQAANTALGVGLGLALCKGLARNLGGELSLDDSVQEGACFVLKLPLKGLRT